MAAAACAAECGVRVGIVDDNFKLGGQIWRGESGDQQKTQKLRTGCSGCACQAPPRSADCASCTNRKRESCWRKDLDGFCELRYEKLMLATGARERFLPFPGWTLPNVMGAGGLQAMVKSGLPIRGKRVVVAGTGPLLLAVAAYLRKHGAEIPMICEQASWSSLASFGLALAGQPAKIFQGLQLKRDLAGVPFAANSWPVAAHGQKTARKRDHFTSRKSRRRSLATTWPAVFIWFPTSNCRCCWGVQSATAVCKSMTFSKRPSHRSSAPANRPASEAWSWRSSKARLPALPPQDAQREAQALFGKRKKARRFAQLLDRTFRLRAELRSLPLPETMVCRCEDVPYSRLQPAHVMALRQTADALRHGPLPGTNLRTRDAISFQVEPGFGSAAGLSRSRGNPGGLSAAVGTATQRSNRRTLMNWKGVMPAITTSFNEDLHVDHGAVRKHCGWLLDNGCAGIVALGSLGEGATLVIRRESWRFCVLVSARLMGADRSWLPSRL